MAWVAFKCIKCNVEYADFDIDPEEVEEMADKLEQDKHNQFLVTCEDCN